MSKPTKEYYRAKAELCQGLAIKQMEEGESAEAGRNLLRMVNALNMLNLQTTREGEESETNQLL